MKAILHKCYDEWGNLKDNALNIAFNLGKKEGLRKGKKIAKAEFIEEFKDLGKLYSEIRADAIEEIKQSIHEIHKCQFYCMEEYCKYDEPTSHDCVECLYIAMQSCLEQLKEQK